MNLGHGFTLDADLRYVGALPDPRVPAYAELNARLGWNITEPVQLSLAGQPAARPSSGVHRADSNAVPRSFLADLQWRF